MAFLMGGKGGVGGGVTLTLITRYCLRLEVARGAHFHGRATQN